MPDLPWLKLWVEIVDDPKLRSWTDTDRWLWVCTLAIARSHGKGGVIPMDLDGVAWRLRRDVAELEAMVQKAMRADPPMVDMDQDGNLHILNFERRQAGKASDTREAIRDRVSRYRDRRTDNGMGRSPGYYGPEIFERDGFACVYCGSDQNLVVDHMIPIVLGGTDNPDNLATACRSCNAGKSGRAPEAAGYTFVNKAVEARYQGHTVDVTSHVTDVTVTPAYHVTSNGMVDVTAEREIKSKIKNKTIPPVNVPPKSRATTVPDPYPITDKILAWAAERGYSVSKTDMERMAETFVNHHAAKGTLYKDWDAAYRNWVIRDMDWGWGKSNGNGNGSGGGGPRPTPPPAGNKPVIDVKTSRFNRTVVVQEEDAK